MENIPNWAFGNVEVGGKPSDVRDFCKLFIFEGEQGNKSPPYFARSFMDDTWDDFYKDKLGGEDVCFNVNFAWSCTSCLLDGYPDEKGNYMTLINACKKYNVNVKIETEEGGMGFEEYIECDSDGDLIDNSIEMPLYKCSLCGEKTQYPSYYTAEDLREQMCCSCDKYCNWERLDGK